MQCMILCHLSVTARGCSDALLPLFSVTRRNFGAGGCVVSLALLAFSGTVQGAAFSCYRVLETEIGSATLSE